MYYIFNKLRKTIVLDLILVMPLGLFANINQIIDQNLKALNYEAPKPADDFFSYAEYIKAQFKQQKKSSPFDKRKNAFGILKSNAVRNTQETQSVLDNTSLQDLNVLCGSKTTPHIYLGSQIDRANTELGKITLLEMICNPVADITTLQNRQAISKELLENKELFDNLNTSLHDIKLSENLIYSFWQTNADVFKSAADKKKIQMPFPSDYVNKLNKNAVLSEARERLDQVNSVVQFATLATATIGLPIAVLLMLTKNKDTADKYILKPLSDWFGITSVIGAISALGLISRILNSQKDNVWAQSGNHIANSLNNGVGFYFSFDYLKSNIITLNCIQEKLISMAKVINLLKQIKHLVNGNDVLAKKLSSLKQINYVLEDLPKKSQDFRRLLNLLSSDTFKGEASMFSNAGKILTTFQLMYEQKNNMAQALIAIGEIDAYMSIAKLIKESETKTNKWSFVNYIESKNKPVLKINNFWNPFISPDKAIANSINMGIKDNPRVMVITGPNAGGKSTTIKAMFLNLILAQSLGIAAAENIQFTPFNKLVSYLNITDDIANGNSHFKAGVLRAKEINFIAMNLKPTEFGFVAVDELFNGTTHKEGQAAAYSFIEDLGENANLLGVTATHFPLITKLENKYPQKFRNYKVSVAHDQDGNLTYPFKLEPGIANQNIAFDILKKEGFTDNFLNKAKKILEEQD